MPQKQFGSGQSGFGLGLALGVLYVPCAGPVLAAIVVAGATGTIGLDTVALTLSFAVGATLPLLFFALAGQRVAERVAAFRRRQREIRIVGGIVTILLAVALVFNLPAVLQRAIPDYTGALQEQVGGEEQLRELNLGGLVNEQNAQLSNCSDGGPELESCGTAPDIKGITKWLNTPGNAPIDLKSLRGKVVLIDFWAYSCINCQRAIPHVVGWYDAYRDKGFEVIGVHTPEYAFEKVEANVVSGAKDFGITYPIAMDNAFSTWTNYRNRYWPAEYLIDQQGTVRHVKFGEGGYDDTEKLIRQLLSERGKDLPPAIEAMDTTPTEKLTPETYFSVGKVVNYRGDGEYDEGTRIFALPAATTRRQLRVARHVGGGLPGHHRAERRQRHRVEIPRPQRLHGRRRYRHGDRHTGRQDDDDSGERAAQHASARGRRPGRRGEPGGVVVQRAAGVFVHLRLTQDAQAAGRPGRRRSCSSEGRWVADRRRRRGRGDHRSVGTAPRYATCRECRRDARSQLRRAAARSSATRCRCRTWCRRRTGPARIRHS